mgnify:FL=1
MQRNVSIEFDLACYGIVSIPDGDWYCGRCEAGDIRAVGDFSLSILL